MTTPRTALRPVALALSALLGLGSCGGPPDTAESASEDEAVRPASALLVDATAGSGVDFVHHSGRSSRRLLPETMGSGVAVLDADGDGLADLVFADGAAAAATRDSQSAGPALAYYRNLGSWRFERVAVDGGLAVDSYAMGLAAGDVDGDGRLDLVATTVAGMPGRGGERLFLNRGGGRFVDASAAWGLEPDDGFGSSVALFDADGDGDLDLYAQRYVEWSPSGDVRCSPDGVHRVYCTPEVYQGAASRFYRNHGERFVDETASFGLAAPGKALGVAVVDVQRDGWLDLAVANDTVPNQLWINRGGGRFEERAGLAGFAVDASGSARGGMGIDAGDLDSDGRTDLVIGNFANETAGLFLGEAEGMFREASAETRLGIPTLLSLTFGTRIEDLDGDGRLDVVFANGHIEPDIEAVSGGRQSHRQPLQVFLNRAGGFDEAPGPAGRFVGRGLASGDLDGDGDPDLVLSQNDGPAVLLRNEAPVAGRIALRLCGPEANTWGYGAEVTIETARSGTVETVVRRLEPSGSYLSSSEPRLFLALDDEEELVRLSVLWPGGRREERDADRLERDGAGLLLRSEWSREACPPARAGEPEAP